MKGKVGLALFFVLGVILVVFLMNRGNPAKPEGEPETASKSDFSDGETLPGFKARRKSSEREIDPAEFEPTFPLLEGEPVVIAEGVRMEDLTPEQLARIEAGQSHISSLITHQKQERFEVQLQELVKGLNLEPSQEGQLRAHYESLQSAIQGGDLQAHGELERLLAGQGMEGLLEEVLTGEQLVQHQAVSEQKRTQAAEIAVSTEMNHLSSLLNLNKEQTIQVEEALRDNALNVGTAVSSDENAVELARMGEQLRAQLSQAEPGENPLQALVQGRMAQVREEKLAPLIDILSSEQLELYRQSLEQREDLSGFENSLKAFGKGGQ